MGACLEQARVGAMSSAKVTVGAASAPGKRGPQLSDHCLPLIAGCSLLWRVRSGRSLPLRCLSVLGLTPTEGNGLLSHSPATCWSRSLAVLPYWTGRVARFL